MNDILEKKRSDFPPKKPITPLNGHSRSPSLKINRPKDSDAKERNPIEPADTHHKSRKYAYSTSPYSRQNSRSRSPRSMYYNL